MATISLNVKTTIGKATQEVRAFATSTKQVQTNLKNVRETSRLSGNQFTALQAKLKGVRQTFAITGETTKGLRVQQGILRREIRNLLKDGVDRASPKIKQLGNQYKRLGQAAKTAGGGAKQLSGSFSGVAKAAVAIGAAVAVVRQLASAFTSSYEASRNFTNELKNVTTLTDTPLETFRTQIEELPPVLGSAAELTKGLYQAISAGVDSADGVEFVGTAAKFAVAGLTDMSSSVDVLTTALNAYGLEIEDTNLVSDLFFKTIEQGKISGEQLSATIGTSITAFAGAKIPLEQLNSGLAALTKVGVDSANATTQLNALVTAFIKPSTALKEALEEQGYASGGALLETEGLTGALEFLQEQTGGNATEIGKLILTARAARGATALLNNESTEYTNILAEMQDAVGSTNDAFIKQVDEIKLLETTTERGRLAFGKLVENIYKNLAPSLRAGAEQFTQLIQSIDFEAVTAGVKVFLDTFSFLIKILSSEIILSIAGAFLAVRGAIVAVTIAQKAWNIVAGLSPLNKMIILIGAVIGAILYLRNNWDTVSLRLMQIWEGLKIGFEALATTFFYYITAIIQPLKALIDGFNAVARAVGQAGLANPLGTFQDFLEKNIRNSNKNIEESGNKIKEYGEQIKEINRLKVEDPTKALQDNANQSNTLNYNFNTNQVVENETEAYEQIADEIKTTSEDLTSTLQTNAIDTAKQYRVSLSDAFKETSKVIDTSLGGTSTLLAGLLTTSQMVTDTILDATKNASMQAIAITTASLMGLGALTQGITQLFTESFKAEDDQNKRRLEELNNEEDAQLTSTKERLDRELADKLANEIDQTRTTAEQQAQRASIIKEYENKNTDEEEKSIARKEKAERDYELQKEDLQRKAFEANKANQIAQIGISAGAAIVNAFATLGPILGGIFTGVIAGVAATQIGVVASKQYTGAGFQTGGSYVVPPGFNDDSYPVRAQSGERVSVTPALENNSQVMTVNVNLDGLVLASTTVDYINRKEVEINIV